MFATLVCTPSVAYQPRGSLCYYIIISCYVKTFSFPKACLMFPLSVFVVFSSFVGFVMYFLVVSCGLRACARAPSRLCCSQCRRIMPPQCTRVTLRGAPVSHAQMLCDSAQILGDITRFLRKHGDDEGIVPPSRNGSHSVKAAA